MEKPAYLITSVVEAKRLLDNGATSFVGSCPEVQACAESIRSGEMRVQTVPPNRTTAKSWNEDRGYHTFHYDTPAGKPRSILSPYIVDDAFLRSIAPEPGERLFVKYDIDGEMMYYRFGHIIKVFYDPERLVVGNVSESGISDDETFHEIPSTDCIASGLGGSMPTWGDAHLAGCPFQVLLKGRQVGPITLLHGDARRKRLSQVDPAILGKWNKESDFPTAALTHPDHIGNTPLHIAAETGEISRLPESVLQPWMFFMENHVKRIVIPYIQDADSRNWLRDFLAKSSPKGFVGNFFYSSIEDQIPPSFKSLIPSNVL